MDPDVWLHMAFGRYVLEHGAFPPGDIFSFTAEGRPWMSSGWAASVLLQAVYQALGAPGLVYLVFAQMAAAYLAVYFTAVRVFGNRGSVLLVLLPALLASYLRFTPRPEVFSQFFLAAVLLVLVTATGEARERRPGMARRLWALPLLFALWANSHAGFLVGLAPAGLCAAGYALRWQRTGARPWLLSALACLSGFVTWMLNPYGPELALLSRKIKSLPGVRELVHEWQPMFGGQGPNLPPATLAGLGLLLGLAVWSGARGKEGERGGRFPFWTAATAALFTALALYEIRHTALAALALVLFAIPRLGWADRLLARPRPLLPALAGAGTLLICALQYQGHLHFGSGWPRAVLDDSLLPHTATAWLQKNRPPANLYNTYGPGGYILYHLGPETKVFMDGRNDVYEPKAWGDYWDIQNGLKSLDEAVSRYGVNTFFIYCKQNNENPNNLANRLTAHPDWRLVYFDDSYAVYVRLTPETADYVRERAFQIVSPFALERLSAALRSPEGRQAAMEEIATALERSGGSAKAHLLASFAARETGDTATAAREMDLAARRDPTVAVMPSPQSQ